MRHLFTASKALSIQSDALDKVAGAGSLVPLKLEGSEGVNQLFVYKLVLQTPDALNFVGGVGCNYPLDELIGHELSCSIELEGHGQFMAGLAGLAGMSNQGAGTREISGLITQARFLGEDSRHALYELTLRPWLYLSTLSSNCRVFQNMTPVQVIEAILNEYSFAVDRRLIASYPQRDYCTQYNETNFEFITRLMQEWGISYWFEHGKGKHQLVMGDHNGAFQASAYAAIAYYPLGHKIDREYIHAFTSSAQLTSSSYASRDYDYTRPRTQLDASASDARAQAQTKQEVYLWRSAKHGMGGSDYSQPNAGNNKQSNQTEEQGKQLAVLRLQHLRQNAQRAKGVGHVRGIQPGHTFTLSEHPQHQANAEYIVLHTQFVIENVNEETQRNAATNALAILTDTQRLSGQWRVEVKFEVQSSKEMLRPLMTQPKPYVYGPQPAIVCGPDAQTAESNLFTETLGRIKIQFPWDRYGTQNNNSSCWVRVASPWAGNQLGAMHLPRVGQEVLVSFYEGDPDLPIVIGSVHNELNQPPWALPSNQALSGFRSRELVPSGGNAAAGRSNHVLLDDTEGKIQAQIKSDHLHSQLSLGHISRIENNQGRKEFRGEGFELRSDGHGALRAQNGLLLTTHGKPAAAEHVLSMAQTTQPLSGAHEQHKNMGSLAVHHLAHEEDEADAVQASLQQQANDLSGNEHTRQEGSYPELQAAHLTLSSPAGIQSTTQGSTHSHSEHHHAITAGKHISLAGAGSFLASVGKNVGLLANKAVRLIAAKGKVQIQAQSNDMELLAQQVLALIGKQGVVVKSDTLIRLSVGAHAVQITPGAGIEFLSPLAPQFHTAAVNLGTPKSASQQMQDSPTSRFEDPYVLTSSMGEPLANMRVRLTRDDGSTQDVSTDAQGSIPNIRSLVSDPVDVQLLGPK